MDITRIFQQPFYTHPCSEVTEDHSRHVIVHQYVGCVKIPNQWVISINGVVLDFPAVVDVLVGSCLWNPDYGLFTITAFDKEGQKVTVERKSNNPDLGTVVPSCTKFIFSRAIDIGPSEVDTTMLAGNSVTEAKLANFSVTNIKLAPDSVSTDKIQDGAITPDEIADQAINTAKLLGYSVTNEKMAHLLDYTPFAPIRVGGITITPSTAEGRYWVFGPFIVVYYRLICTVAADSVLGFLDLSTPVPGRTNYSLDENWLGVMTLIDSTTASGMRSSTLRPIINVTGSGGASRARVNFAPTAAVTAGDVLSFIGFCVYPIR